MSGHTKVKGPKNKFMLEFNLSKISKKNIDSAKPENKGVLLKEFYIPGKELKSKLNKVEFGNAEEDVPIEEVGIRFWILFFLFLFLGCEMRIWGFLIM